MQSITEFDIFYLSYDEPKKEEFYADILNKCPWVKRVDGVKGFDNAHKECARQSDTSRFITVDGDNIVDADFFDIQFSPVELPDNAVISWAGKNVVNGLIYGNGGVKLWPKSVVLNMQTHENSNTDKNQIEFCWDLHYLQMNNCYSTVHINGSPYQAFRAGFREGVKMSLEQGARVSPELFEKSLHDKNYHRLLIWCNVGRDVEFGEWAMYGARLGCYMTNIGNLDITQVRDYDWFNDFWTNDIGPTFDVNNTEYNKVALQARNVALGQDLAIKLKMQISELDATASAFFKKVFVNPARVMPFVDETAVTYTLTK